MIDHVSQTKGENKKLNNKNVDCKFYKLTQSGSGFDSF